jgi:hypothetical protein
MSLHAETSPHPASSPTCPLFQMNSIRTNIIPPLPYLKSHIRCEPIFNNIFGDKPRWIDPATTYLTQLVLGKLKEGSFLFCSQFLNNQSNSRNLILNYDPLRFFLTSPRRAEEYYTTGTLSRGCSTLPQYSSGQR